MISHVHDCQLSVYIQSSTSGWPTKESSNLLLGVREHLVGVWGSAVGGFLRPGPESRCFGKGDWLPRRDLPCQAHTTLRGSLHCVPSAHPLKRKWDVSALQRTRTPSTRPSPNPLWVWFQDKITSSTVPGTGCFKNRNEGNGNPLQYSSLEQRSQVGYSPWRLKESETSDPLTQHKFQCYSLKSSHIGRGSVQEGGDMYVYSQFILIYGKKLSQYYKLIIFQLKLIIFF